VKYNRVNVSIESEILKELDLQAKKSGLNRSAYITHMVLGRRDLWSGSRLK
jgi:metal-responsive CopG/Arc/MetJ family transcriptional regulator